MRCSSARAVHGQIGQVVSRYVSNSIQRRFTSSTSPIGRSATSLTSKTPGLCRGRRVLLTGGTSGIGLSVAHRLRQEGAELCVLAVRDEDRGQKARNIVLRSGVTGFEQGSAEGREDVSMDVRLLVINDLTDSRLLRKEVTNAMREWEFDTIISCHGMSENRLMLRTSQEDCQKIMNTNLTSNQDLATVFLQSYHKASKRARKSQEQEPSESNSTEDTTREPPRSHVFVAVSSLLANKGGNGASTYAVSKAGLHALVRTLCLEGSTVYKKAEGLVAPFRANLVVPGYVETPMTEGLSVNNVPDIPLGRFGTTEEVADAIMFLVANEYANNTVLNLDGGLSAK